MSFWHELIALSRAPYSGKKEACLIRGREGWHVGIRIENIAYPQTITALQGGMAACLFAGDRPQEIVLPPVSLMPIPADLAAWIQGSAAYAIPSDSSPAMRGDETGEPSGALPVSHAAKPAVSVFELRRNQRERFVVDVFADAARYGGVSQAAGTPDTTYAAMPSQAAETQAPGSLRLDSVDPADDRARAAALDALTSKAVTPNSDFPVSALLETDIGVVGGCNVEFPSWNLGLCAERNAIHLALSMGAGRLGSMAIYAPKSEVCSPCGACRQTLAEWPDINRVLLYHGDGSCSAHRVEDLLPFHFHASGLSSHE